MSASKNVALEVKQLKKSYYHLGREVSVLRGMDLVVHDADMVSVVGTSGVGKSTFLHVAGTLDRPTSGSVHYWGQDVFTMPDSELANFRNRNIGFVFQFHHLLPELNSLENVMIPGLIAGENQGSLKKRSQELLDQVGLSHRLTHRPGELSGGEQQRVAIARALIMRPKLVFADEPTGNLDEKTSDDVHSLLFQLNEQFGVAFVIVTHNFDLARKMNRHFTMHDGHTFDGELTTE